MAVCLGTLPPQAQHWVGPGRKARRELWSAVTRPKRLEVQWLQAAL